jgi:hypothetical protein
MSTPDTDDAVDTVIRWLAIRERSGQPMPTSYRQLVDDIRHSALLHRLLSGMDPLGAAPPRCYGQPWYNLLDTGAATGCDIKPLKDRLGAAPRVAINEYPWVVVEHLPDGGYVVQYNPQSPRFLATPSPGEASGWELRRVDSERDRWGAMRPQDGGP